MTIAAILEELVASTGASRATLRHRTEGAGDAGFPVVVEALAAEAGSIRTLSTPNMGGQPVVLRVLTGEQVVQDDCRTAFPGDEPFHRMLELYGGMRAQIVTPIVEDGATVAILSLHELKRPRAWTAAEIDQCREATRRIQALLRETAS